MTITPLNDITDKNETHDAVMTPSGIVLVAKTETRQCDGCVFDKDDLDDARCSHMPRCDSHRTDNRAIIWVVKPAETPKSGSPELQQLVNLTQESMLKNPAQKTYDPQEIKVRLNTMLHQVASLNQTTNLLKIWKPHRR